MKRKASVVLNFVGILLLAALLSNPAVAAQGPSPETITQSDSSLGIGHAYLHRVVNGYTASEALYQATFLSVPYIVWEGGLHNFYVFNLYGDPTVRITDTSANGKSRLTIPAAAFTPFQDGYDYENHGRFLIHKGGPEGWYFAPVHLPHGAQVTKMIFNWYNNSQTGQAKARLQRTEFGQGDYLQMAYAETGLGGTGYGTSQDDTIAYATIDNAKYAYWANFDLPATTDVRGCSVVVEYIPPTTVTGRLSIPAAAFKPREDGYDYKNHARFLEHYHGPGGSETAGQYFAPVFLPHGAKVTKMTFHWYNSTAALQGDARLMRTVLGTGNNLEMAHATSAGAGYGSSYDDTIDHATIDNSGCAYYATWHLPPPLLADISRGCGVVIEYDLPTAATSRGYISVPAAAFAPLADEWDYNIDGCLEHFGGAARGHYEAAVYLPQGMSVSKVTFHYYDESTGECGYANMCRFDLVNADDYPYMTTIASAGSSGWGAVSSAAIGVPVVDNSQYGYWVYLDLPDLAAGHIAGCAVVIEYGYCTYLPLILKNK